MCILPSLWSDRDQIWGTHVDSSRKGSGLNKNQPRVTQGVLGGQQVWIIYQTAEPIGTRFGTRLQIHRGMDPRYPRGAFWGFRRSKFHQKFEECHDMQRENEYKLYKNEMHKYT